MKLSTVIASTLILSSVMSHAVFAAPATTKPSVDKSALQKTSVLPKPVLPQTKEKIVVKPAPTLNPATARKLPVLPGGPKKPELKGSGCPDLAVTRFEPRWIARNADGSYTFKLLAIVENVGSVNYQSQPTQQSISFKEGHRMLDTQRLTDRTFAIDYAPGEQQSSIVTVQNWHPSSEFLADFSAQLNFDPDLYIDGNPANDDCVRTNHTARLTVASLRDILARH